MDGCEWISKKKVQAAQQTNIILRLKTPISSYVCDYEADIAIVLIVQRRFCSPLLHEFGYFSHLTPILNHIMMTLTLFVLLRVHQETAITLPIGACGQGRDLSAVTGAAAAAAAVQSRQNIDYSPPPSSWNVEPGLVLLVFPACLTLRQESSNLHNQLPSSHSVIIIIISSGRGERAVGQNLSINNTFLGKIPSTMSRSAFDGLF